MNKSLIKMRFAKNLDSYHEHAKIQKLMSEKLVKFLEKNAFDSVLELGCGTGFLTEQISKKIQYNAYTAIDIVPECKSYINKIDSKIQFLAEDIETFVKNNPKTYDLIVSNASLQWVENLKEFIKILLERLNKNGILLFSTFGKRNFQEIYKISGKTLSYINTCDLENEFKDFSIITDEEIHILNFNSPKEILRHMQLTGVNAIENITWTKGDMFKFERDYLDNCNGAPTLTYNPIYIKICNNKNRTYG